LEETVMKRAVGLWIDHRKAVIVAIVREGAKNVLFIGSVGYENVPKDVEYVTAQMCAQSLLTAKKKKNVSGLTSISVDGIRTSYSPSSEETTTSPARLTADLRENLPPVIGDPDQLQQPF
jgi:hypothetical protein